MLCYVRKYNYFNVMDGCSSGWYGRESKHAGFYRHIHVGFHATECAGISAQGQVARRLGTWHKCNGWLYDRCQWRSRDDAECARAGDMGVWKRARGGRRGGREGLEGTGGGGEWQLAVPLESVADNLLSPIPTWGREG